MNKVAGSIFPVCEEGMTVLRHLKGMRKVSVVGKWVTHDLSPESLQQRISCCESINLRSLRRACLGEIASSFIFS